MFKRKLQWILEGFDAAGKQTFPAAFVKLHKRPAFSSIAIADEYGGQIVQSPSQIEFCHYIDYDIEMAKLTTKACLKLVDATFKVIEQWDFFGSKLDLLSVDIMDYNVVCNETWNTQDVIDKNELRARINIKTNSYGYWCLDYQESKYECEKESLV